MSFAQFRFLWITSFSNAFCSPFFLILIVKIHAWFRSDVNIDFEETFAVYFFFLFWIPEANKRKQITEQLFNWSAEMRKLCRQDSFVMAVWVSTVIAEMFICVKFLSLSSAHFHTPRMVSLTLLCMSDFRTLLNFVPGYPQPKVRTIYDIRSCTKISAVAKKVFLFVRIFFPTDGCLDFLTHHRHAWLFHACRQ